MAVDLVSERSSTTPGTSGRSTPVQRNLRRTAEENDYKSDKLLRKYAAGIERALHAWEGSPEEWADYIALLGQLSRSIQNRPKNAALLPHSSSIASKLAMCLTPPLPSGVHQKALEVYAYIFSIFNERFLAGHLHEFLPGLSAVLSFASLSVRPGLYAIFEDHIVRLPASDLRPVLKSLILALLPALEEEASEDFPRAFAILENLERAFCEGDDVKSDKDGYFWQCLFLAVITSPSRRQGSLRYLNERLPKFAGYINQSNAAIGTTPNGDTSKLSPSAELAISPEPGLLVRCFVCGLHDPQILIQRGFLDLLVTHLPLKSPLFQDKIDRTGLDKLMSAATYILLRRDMSLNRRLWSWLLGPDPADKVTHDQTTSPDARKTSHSGSRVSPQFQYFKDFGQESLERCILALLSDSTQDSAEKARPFRICLSLMDRWEIGGTIVPTVFLPAIESVYEYSLSSTAENSAGVIKSASLFFDGIESKLIWAKLMLLFDNALDARPGMESLDLFTWTIQHFNIQDEEMLTMHVPYAIIYILSTLADAPSNTDCHNKYQGKLKVLNTLMSMVPERAFAAVSGESNGKQVSPNSFPDGRSLRGMLRSFYEGPQQLTSNNLPFRGRDTSEVMYRILTSLLLGYLDEGQAHALAHLATLLLTLHSKCPASDVLRSADLMQALQRSADRALSAGGVLPFITLNSMVSLVGGLYSASSETQHIPKRDVIDLEKLLTAQIWSYLRSSAPKYHVEAVRLIWQLHDVVASDLCIEASLNSLVRGGECSVAVVDSVQCFATLWRHSVHMAPLPSTMNNRTNIGQTRKGSTAFINSESKSTKARLSVLTEPLMLVLDLLDRGDETAQEYVSNWLSGLSSLDLILVIHFEELDILVHNMNTIDIDQSAEERRKTNAGRDLEYILGHLFSIVKTANDHIWQRLSSVPHTSKLNGRLTTCIVSLAEYCLRVMSNSDVTSPSLQRKAMDTLLALLTGPSAILLRDLELEYQLLDQLKIALANSRGDIQKPLLKLLAQSVKLRVMGDDGGVHTHAISRSSSILPGTVTNATHRGPDHSGAVASASAPLQLLDSIRTGFSCSSARPYLEEWTRFLAIVLPVFADAIFNGLIPLVECLCLELDRAHNELCSVTSLGAVEYEAAPEATASSLLEALELVLARAHECLLEDHSTEAATQSAARLQSGVSNTSSALFKVEGPPSHTAQANRRLTVVLAFQDSIRVCFRLWSWASHYSDDEGFDKVSAATTSFVSNRVRTRTRHLLERIFAIEPLESLEVVMSIWCIAPRSSNVTAAIDLLHAMQESRPRHVVSAIFDALCSRTNPQALPQKRRSSQTTNLTAPQIATFLKAYLHSIEDDAIDEVWSDCMAFYRDVLANPLPYRQVFPSLLSSIFLIAQKVDNTNFGEQRKMRRELGDSFSRLLSATFTTMPAGYVASPIVDAASHPDTESRRAADGDKSDDLTYVIKHTMSNIEVVVETSDRVVVLINNISANLIGPMFRAKAFPRNITLDSLELLLQMMRKAPAAKLWKKDITEAFANPQFLASSIEQMQRGWFPVLRQWFVGDKDRMPDLLSRLAPPSSAGIMFGVGANAARLEADRKTRLNLRKICVALLCSAEDTFVAHVRELEEKLTELFQASPSSSPSAATKADLFMLCRALVLSTSAVHLASLWPVVNNSLQAALTSLVASASHIGAFSNLALLQACKLLDLLIVLSPDEFQLHEWLYISDTIDAVYHPSQWSPAALSDQIAETLATEGTDDLGSLVTPVATLDGAAGHRRLLLDKASLPDTEDIRATSREDFLRAVLRPFLSQLSIHAYEGIYSMEAADLASCRRNLLEDLLDTTTIVE